MIRVNNMEFSRFNALCTTPQVLFTRSVLSTRSMPNKVAFRSKRRLRSLVTFCTIATLSLVLAGCAGLGIGGKRDNTEKSAADKAGPHAIKLTGDFSRSKLIAADFVATLTQLPETNPTETTLQTGKPASRFGQLLLSALQRAGYDLRSGNQEAPNWLTYTADEGETLSDYGNPVYTFIVSAGDVKLKRSYEVDQHGVRPAGSMFVRGANTDNVVLDDSIFSVKVPPATIADTSTDPDFTAASAENDVSEISSNEAVQIAAVPTPKPFVKTAKALTPTIKPFEDSFAKDNNNDNSESPSPSVSMSKSQQTQSEAGDDPFSQMSNMYETGESRYQEIFKKYNVVETDVLVFPDDSLILGSRNKQSLKRMVEDFNPQTDLISVIGCSHGSTKIANNGNAYLANNRAFRVKEEFVSYGLAAASVLEEGCWAGTPFPKMPARGVLVQHKRVQ